MMEFTRRMFLAGASLGTIAMLPEVSEAAPGDQAVIVSLFVTPKDPEGFDKHYFETHAQLVKQLPGITSYRVSKGAISILGMKQSPYHLIQIVGFDSMSSLQSAIVSPVGEKLTEDAKHFAESGISTLIFTVGQA